MLQYNYSWGDEDVSDSHITVTKGTVDNGDIYIIVFIQEGDYPEYFDDLDSTCTILSKDVENK